MRGASARPFNPRAFIRDAISAPGRHAPSLAPPPLVKTSCFHCSKCHNLNSKTDRVFVFCLLSFVFCLLSFVFCLLSFDFWVLGFGFWVLGFGFWVLGFGFWVLGFGFWVLGFGF
ncbi:hypothetical protein EYY91_22065 [Hafnia alvei]|nr:hypothetical protein EYY91_22065 [Hafnia alvei]